VRCRWFLGETTTCGFDFFHPYAKITLCSLILDGVGGPAGSLAWFDLSPFVSIRTNQWTRQTSLSALHALDGTSAVAAILTPDVTTVKLTPDSTNGR
jgi:hypothetical protein